MKPEVSEQLFIEELFANSKEKKGLCKEGIINIERLTGDASTRRYYRVFCAKNSYVVCLDNPTKTIEENSFLRVQAFLNAHSIRVPQVLHTIPSRGYILEEDLGDITLLQHLSTTDDGEVEYELYKKVVDELLKLHRIKSTEQGAEEIFKLAFDFEKLNFEIEFTVKYFIKSFLGVEDEKIHQQLIDLFKPICNNLASYPMVLTHRDFHSRNIMVKDNELVVIDFQDARLGIPQYDLTSLLDDCYYSISRENQYKLLCHYYENSDVKRLGYNSFEHFREIYDEMVLQRAFKAVGSFSYIYHNRKDQRYVKYIGFAMEKIRSYMMKHPKYNELRKLLFSIYYAN